VVEDLVQDFLQGGLFRIVSEDIYKILHEFVLLAVFEHCLLLVKENRELVILEEGVLLRLVQIINLWLDKVMVGGIEDFGDRGLDAFPLGSELLILGECHFRLTHLIEVGTIHRTFFASQRLGGFLEKRSTKTALLI
jgi:hypothetical protein